MPKVILQLHLDSPDPSVEHVRELLGLSADQIDADFGVRRVRGDAFAVRVDPDVAGRVREDRRGRRARAGRGDTRVALIH